MNSLIIAVFAFFVFIIAYNSYGKFLARKVFKLKDNAICPSISLKDNIDFVPTKKSVLFGHHFASIAGTGPIVGPAIAAIWGWLPAFLWILIASVFMGAVHDFGSMIVSLRNKGTSIGDICAKYINKRVRILFLLIIFFELLIVVAIFGVVIAIIFNIFPQSVMPVWLQIPIAVILGFFVYKQKINIYKAGLIAVIFMYLTILLGAYFPIRFETFLGLTPMAFWVMALLVYAYIASILPVQTLLQPRDFINAYQLVIALFLLVAGLLVSHPVIVAPIVNLSPKGAPPIFPMLFVVVACGAISGFHSLVSSGTSSKQCDKESSALPISYGSMLLEAMVAILVIICCTAGIGLGLNLDGNILFGLAAYEYQYADWSSTSGLGAMLNAFIVGAGNMVHSLGIPENITYAVMGVFVASFAATTLDTAARLQRYTVTELVLAVGLKRFSGKHYATFIAVGTAFLLAFYNGSGNGALTLWPLFGSVNQLLAGLALLVITIYLVHKKVSPVYTFIPMVFIVLMTGWAMVINLSDFYIQQNWLLFVMAIIILMLEIWMILECLFVVKSAFKNK